MTTSYFTCNVSIVVCVTVPEVAVTVIVYVLCCWPKNPFAEVHPLSAVIAAIPVATISNTERPRRSRLPARRMPAAKGISKIPHATGGILCRGESCRGALAASDGSATVKLKFAIGVCAGNDQEVALSWVQIAGVMEAVEPAGNPVSVRITGAGNSVPAVGAMLSK